MFTINGVDYPSWDQVPEELRRQLAALPDADGNGIPDFAEKIAVIGAPAPSVGQSPSEPAFSRPSAIPVSPSAPNLEPEQTGLRFGVIAFSLLALLCLGGLALWFLFTQML